MIKLFLEENKHNERKFYGSYPNEQEARKAIIEYSEKHGYHRPFGLATLVLRVMKFI